MAKLENILSVGFDLDGTLYPLTSEINDRIRTEIARKLILKNPDLKDIKQAKALFEKRYFELKSGTQILSEAGYENASEIMDQCLTHADVLSLIEPNEKLAEILQQIRKQYETYILTSSPKQLSLRKLERLSIPPHLFSFMVFSDTEIGISKSKGTGFDYILSLSLNPAQNHIYIGDRLSHDILPAKAKGMKTVAVYSNIPEADYHLKRIEDISELLL